MAAKTHCPAGHPYSGDNLFHDKNGGRLCRTCSRKHKAESYWRHRDRICAERAAKYVPTSNRRRHRHGNITVSDEQREALRIIREQGE
ncbi:hypothetical protein [Rhizorhabdus histidinilytica]|uniref:hypothetical protein n=1 Tax=Rhizorhabdus histidinilytica TaxID=439228 RepID=UPI001F47BFAB|nr:hypothetical protein [Rhizorhabdus histidinilytica]